MSHWVFTMLEIIFILKLAHTYKNDVCLSYKKKEGVNRECLFTHPATSTHRLL